MSVFYKVIPRKTPGDPEGEVKYYATQKMTGTATLNEVCDYIAPRAGRSAGSVKTIIEDCATAIAENAGVGPDRNAGRLRIVQGYLQQQGCGNARSLQQIGHREGERAHAPEKNLKNAAEQGVKLVSIGSIAAKTAGTETEEAGVEDELSV